MTRVGDNRPMALSFLYLMARSLVGMLLGRLRSEQTKDVEIAVLRHQLQVLRRQVKRPEFRPVDRALLAALSRALPRGRWSSFLVTPDTILRWHRRLVTRKWTRPCHRGGRPCLASDFVSDIRVVITPHPVGSSGLEQEGGDDPAGLRARPSWAPRQAVPEPEPEVRAVAAAGDRRAEPGRGGRALRDRPVDGRAHPSGRQQGALEALAASKPGVRQAREDAELAAARAEIQRLGETVKEQAIELMLLRGKSRWG